MLLGYSGCIAQTLLAYWRVKASGRLESLIRSGLRYCENFAVIDARAAGATEPVTVLRIGPDLVFGGSGKNAVFRR
jgi:hypothetical protein